MLIGPLCLIYLRAKVQTETKVHPEELALLFVPGAPVIGYCLVRGI